MNTSPQLPADADRIDARSRLEAQLDAGAGLGYILDTLPGGAYLKTRLVPDETLGRVIQTKLENWSGQSCAEYLDEWKMAAKRELVQ